MKKYLTFDLVRTRIKYAIVTEDLDILNNDWCALDPSNQEEIINYIIDICNSYKREVEGVIISMPGVINSERGYVYSGGIYGWAKDFYLGDIIEKKTSLKTVICNDAKCAAYAEIGYGALKGIDNGVLVMLMATGIGGAIIIDGKVIKGEHNASGEFSYMHAHIGHQENDMFYNVLSYNALVERVSAEMNTKYSLMKIMGAINEGNDRVISIVNSYCDDIATYLFNIQCVVDAKRFAIGGEIVSDPYFL